MSNVVYVVHYACGSQDGGPEAIFSKRELAEEYIKMQPKSQAYIYFINEYELDTGELV